MKYNKLPGLFFFGMAALTGACSKNLPASASNITDSVETNGFTPMPIYCLYSPVQTGTRQIPHPRNWMQTAATGNNIAFFSGTSLQQATVFNGADVFNVTTNTWTSEPFEQVLGAAATACNGKIAFGGGLPTDAPLNTDVVHLLDVPSGQWSSHPLSIPRYDLAAAGYGNKILFAGGENDEAQTIVYSQVDIYDAPSNTWSTAELSVPRRYLAAAAANNVIAFAGGQNAAETDLKTVDFYDVTTGHWSHSALSVARYGLSGIGAGNLIFFAGGSIQQTGPSDVCDIYNTISKTWTHTHLPHTSGSNQAVSIGAQVIFFEGYHNIADVYNTCSNTWSTMKFKSAGITSAFGSAGGKMLVGSDNLALYQEEELVRVQ